MTHHSDSGTWHGSALHDGSQELQEEAKDSAQIHLKWSGVSIRKGVYIPIVPLLNSTTYSLQADYCGKQAEAKIDLQAVMRDMCKADTKPDTDTGISWKLLCNCIKAVRADGSDSPDELAVYLTRHRKNLSKERDEYTEIGFSKLFCVSVSSSVSKGDGKGELLNITPAKDIVYLQCVIYE